MECGLIFDMDGVVIDSNPYHKKAWYNFLYSKGLSYDDQLFENVLSGRTGPTSLKILMGDQLPKETMNQYLEEIDSGYRNILREAKEVIPVPGLHEFLDRIKIAGHRVALATSAPPGNITLGLEKLKLAGTFEVIVGKEDVTHGKPDPEVYLTTVERLGIPAENCLVFEDSKVGIQSALSAGLKVVGIASMHSKEELLDEGASMAVTDFTELDLETVVDLIRNRIS